MTDREKQIDEMIDLMGMFDDGEYNGMANCLYNAGYRKMDEVTLRLDLGDRSAEEIKQIAEAFNGEIKKQVAKEILQVFWQIKHGQTELDNVCIRLSEKFGLLKELQGE